MSDWFKRTKTVTRVEYVVPAHRPYGANWNEVLLAIDNAIDAARRGLGVGADRPLSDDAIQVLPGDDEIIIYYQTEGDERA